MYKVCKILSLLVIVMTFMAVPGEAAKKNIAVMPVYTSTATVQSGTETMIYRLVAENMTAQLISALYDSDDYVVLEREEVKQGIEKFEIQAGKVIDKQQAITVGKHLEADYSIIGKVNSAKIIDNEDKNTLQDIKNRIEQDSANIDDSDDPEVESDEESNISATEYDFQGRISVELRLIDNETGEVVFKDVFKSIQPGDNGADSLRAACKAVAEEFVPQIAKYAQTVKQVQPEQVTEPEQPQPQPVQQNAADAISVIDVSDGIAYIDKGIEIGLQEGDILNVVKKEPVKNLKGQIITYKKAILGKLEIQEVNEGHCICKIIEEVAEKSIKRGSIAEKAKD